MASSLKLITILPLDESLYKLDNEQTTFFKTLTRIQDDKQLKQHIISVQRKAYQLHGYPCIRRFSFLEMKISGLPAYPQVLKLLEEHDNAILLDIGCCFGNDARKAAYDGWPVQNIVASDIVPKFWEYGHELFRSTSESFPVKFIPGDVFDPDVILPRDPFYDEPTTERPDISTLSASLTPLQGRISAIHASSFFHLFEEEQQLDLARRLASLLSPKSGSTIFGSHASRLMKLGKRMNTLKLSPPFAHSQESWAELWDGVVFKMGSVRVETTLQPLNGPEFPEPDSEKAYLLKWSVTRV